MNIRFFLVLIIGIQSLTVLGQSMEQKVISDSIAFLKDQNELRQLHLDPIGANLQGTHLRIWLASQVIDLVVADAAHVSGRLIDFVYIQPSECRMKRKPWKMKYYSRETTIVQSVASKIYNQFLERKVMGFPEKEEEGDKILVQFLSNGELTQRTFSAADGRLAASFSAFLNQTLNLSDSFELLVKRLSPGTYCVGSTGKITIRPNRLDIPEETDWYDYEQEGYD